MTRTMSTLTSNTPEGHRLAWAKFSGALSTVFISRELCGVWPGWNSAYAEGADGGSRMCHVYECVGLTVNAVNVLLLGMAM